jgi:two-component system, LuxR family, sensor kinase FixL
MRLGKLATLWSSAGAVSLLRVNLLINSIQAIAQSGQPKRRIDVETSIDEGGSVVFAVFDNGPGLAGEDLDRVFESFFSTKAAGIGLAICQPIITAHGGSISDSNRGSNWLNGGAHLRFALAVLRVAAPESSIVDLTRQKSAH